MNRLSLSTVGIAAVALLLAPGCMSSSPDSGMTAGASAQASAGAMQPSRTLVETASNTSSLSTLVSAVQAADLVSTLNGPGPFTVFAPTNAAFEAVPSDALQSLLQPQNKAQLQSVLTYHVVPGRLMAADLRDGQMLTTVNGAQLRVTKQNGTVMVGNATVTQANVSASNGIAHIIDGVLMP